MFEVTVSLGIEKVLKCHGRYAVSGAIAGPIVELDVRTLYLKDLSFYGCTILEPEVFQNLINCIEQKKIAPILAQSFPLNEIGQAQQSFLEKKCLNKLAKGRSVFSLRFFTTLGKQNLNLPLDNSAID